MKIFLRNITLIFSLLLILLTVSEAQYWQKITSIPAPYDKNYWLDIYFSSQNPNYIWICGFNGMVVRSTDGGNSWAGATIPATDHFESINFPTTTTGYVSGPAGLYKSTDGGASWFNIQPDSATQIWGLYFIDANNGVVVGAGCYDQQQFWRTTDGGLTWTLFLGNEPNSGMTHVLMYPGGIDYAESSGWIWRSTDAGFTWSTFSNTGTNLWQEYLSINGNSILVPYAGVNCEGGGPDGGMRFTTDFGTTWKSFQTGVPMFGAWATGAKTGWACGYTQAVYYTSDGGSTWQMKNCGISPGNLDCIWMFDDNNGWVVGEGVYKLTAATYLTNKNQLNFPETCYGSYREDSVKVINFTNNSTNATWTISGTNASEFSVTQPLNPTFSITSCDSQIVVVRFTPTSIGNKTANLRIAISGGPNFDIALTGIGDKSTVTTSDTLIVIDSAACGSKSSDSLVWKALKTGESISNIDYSSGSTVISLSTTLPITITQTGIKTVFSIIPIDTGWCVTRFKVHLLPCDVDTFITVKAYGISPIITSKGKIDNNFNCTLKATDTIPICNTGNSDLIISNAVITDANLGFAIGKWASGSSVPVTIQPGNCDTVFVDFSPKFPGQATTSLKLFNNDRTTYRGNKNPLIIDLKSSILSTLLTPKDTAFDFGRVCIGDTSMLSFYLKNMGNMQCYISKPVNNKSEFRAIIGNGYYPANIQPQGDSALVRIFFNPQIAGNFSDTILLISATCNDTIKIAVKGSCIYSSISLQPQSIQGIIYSQQLTAKYLTITNDGVIDLTISNLDFLTLPNGWTANIIPTLPVNIKAGDSIKFSIDFLAASDTVVNIQLCINATGECPLKQCIPVNLTSSGKAVEVLPDNLDFGITKCRPETYIDTITVLNSGLLADTLTDIGINPSNSRFVLLTIPQLPKPISAGDSIKLAVEFTASDTSLQNAMLIIQSLNMHGKSLQIPLSGSFAFSDTIPQNKIVDFGSLETCQPIRYRRIVFYNQGNLADTFKVIKPSDELGFELFTADTMQLPDYLKINANDSLVLIVSCNPALFNSIGFKQIDYYLNSLVCGVQDTITAETDIIHPVLTVQPTTLDFGSIWKGDSLDNFVTIKNNSTSDQNITKIELSQSNFSLINAPSLPYLIKAGSTLNLDLRFVALDPGNFYDTLLIESMSACPDTNIVTISSIVPNEIYSAKIFIDRYTCSPGQTVDLTMNLDSALLHVELDSASFEIGFDKWLFLPSEVYTNESNNKSVQKFTYSNGIITCQIKQTDTKELLKTAGPIIYISGLTFPSTPDSTPLVIDKFEVRTSKALNLTTENGFLLVSTACAPIAGQHIQFIIPYDISFKNEVITDGNLGITLTNDYNKSCSVKIYNLIGDNVFSGRQEIMKGENELNFNLNAINSGTYFVNISIDGNIEYRRSIIILK